MLAGGQSTWHPNPDIFYRDGAGPLLDMGPYYLTAIVALLGPIRRVAGFASTRAIDRVIEIGPRAGTPSRPRRRPTPRDLGARRRRDREPHRDLRGGAVHRRLVDLRHRGRLILPDPNTFEARVSSGAAVAAGRTCRSPRAATGPAASGWTTSARRSRGRPAPRVGRARVPRGRGRADDSRGGRRARRSRSRRGGAARADLVGMRRARAPRFSISTRNSSVRLRPCRRRSRSDGAVLTIVLNRPEAYNAFTRELHGELHPRARPARAASDDVRAVVITGAGKAFCAGQDL